ncbi:YopX family protein [Bacillus altitudinis]|nr:YopX family protein [Bacillus altitudinis]MBU8970336.1 YopX family protein [Bacillus altitudinis]
MREIKFRAFEKHSQRMFYNVQSGIYMDPDEFESFNDILGLARYKVMQFTGLKDKNGDEIYEGDVVQGSLRLHGDVDPIMRKVCMHKGCYMFGVWNAHEYFNKHQHIEVVGNIYQNPDLLEEAQ